MSQNDTATSILHAARDLFAEKGFGNISTRLIARRAGVNEVTLFRHFGTKTALYEAVFDYFGSTSGVYASFEKESVSVWLSPGARSSVLSKAMRFATGFSTLSSMSSCV